MPEAPAEKRTRTRAKAEYWVEEQDLAHGTDSEPQWRNVRAVPKPFDTSAKASSWIRKSGVEDVPYRVIRIVVPPVTVTVEKIEKRTLT